MKRFYLILTIAVLAIFMAPHADAIEIYTESWDGNEYDSIYGEVEPDKIEGDPWICLSPNSADSGIAIYKFTPAKPFLGLYKYTVSVYGYDRSLGRVKTKFGLFDFNTMSGEIVYLGNSLTGDSALVSGSVTSSLERFLSSKNEIWVVILSTPAQEGHIKSVELEVEHDCFPPAVPEAPWSDRTNDYACAFHGFKIEWNAVPEATMYRLYEDGVLLYEYEHPDTSTGVITYPAGSYVYTVSAGNEDGWSAQGEGYLFTVLPDPGVVEQIYIPSGDQCDSVPFEISWSTATDASSYGVYLSENNPPSQLGQVYDFDTTIEVSLTPGKYYFRLRSWNYLCAGDYSAVDSFTVVSVPVPVWASTDMSNLCQSSAYYHYWVPIPEATEYRVFENGVLCGTFDSETRRIMRIYHEGGEWEYYMQAAIGNCWSDNSDTITIAVRYEPLPPEPAQPSISPATVCPNLSYVVSWLPVAGAVDYRLYENGIKVYEDTMLNFVRTNGNEPGSYEYSLRAYDGFCYGPESDKLNLVIPGLPDPPGLISPLNAATGISMPFTLDWEDATYFSWYRVVVDNNSNFSSPEIYEQLLVSEYVVSSGLTPGETYYWQAMVYSVCDWGDWSDPRYFTTDCPTPEPPTLELPADGATDISQPITWDWNDVSEATKYHIQVDNDNADFNSLVINKFNILTSDFTYDGLADATDYWWRVRSGNDCGWSEWSDYRSFTTDCPVPDPPILTFPSDEATDVSQPVTWDWGDVSEATKYHIQVDDDNFDFKSLVVNNDGRISSDFIWDGLADATNYYWRVRSGNDCGWSEWSDYRSFTTDCPEPDSPSLISPLNLATGISMPFTLDWEDATYFNWYRVVVDNNSDFSSHEIYEEVLVSEYIVSSGLTPGETYYWRAMVHNDCGTSTWSLKRSFTMDCPVPDPPTLELPADGATVISQPVMWDWSDVSEATKYHIQVDKVDSDFNNLVITKFNILTSDFTYDGLADGTDYWWRVRSGNDCGSWSDWSLVFPFSVDEQTDVTEISSEELPGEFTLSQNYPNPFNPVTNIDFALPRAAHVRIEVYNILGSKISTLVDEYLSAGYKSVEWDGRSSSGQAVSSGVYLFQITAGEFSASRKAVLMK